MLSNFKGSVVWAEKDLVRRTNELARSRADAAFYEKQIIEAERRGLKEFDADRLLVTRKR